MNRTAIEWCDYTFNPVTGCKHNCPYCYARKIAERFKGSKAWPQGFEPMIHHERLRDPAKMTKQQTIFVCSMADLFGEWVPDLWINLVMDACLAAPQHTYIFLTKNPKRYLTIPGQYLGQSNFWWGTTVTNAFDAGQRIHWIQRLPEGNAFISFEPLLGDPSPLNLKGIRQVIIGAQTNPYIYPDGNALNSVHQSAREAGCKIFYKDSIKKELLNAPRELCWSLNK